MKKLRTYLWVVAALLLVMALIVPYLNRSARLDEADTFVHFTSSPIDALFFYARPNNHLLHSFFVWLSRTLVGSSLIALRLPTFFGGILSLALLYRLGKRLHSHQLGLLALALLAMIVSYLEYFIDARGYTLTAALTLLLVEQLWFTRPPIQRGNNYRILLTAFLLVLTIPANVMLIAGGILWIAWHGYQDAPSRRYKRKVSMPQSKWLQYGFSLLFGVLLALPFYSMIFLDSALLGSTATGIGWDNFAEMSADWARQVFGVGQPTGTLVLIALIIGFGVLVKQRRWRVLSLVALITGIIVPISLIQLLLTKHVFFARNFFYLLPLVALVGAYCVVLLPRQIREVAALALILTLLIPAPAYFGQKSHVDDALSFVYNNLDESHYLIAGCCLEYPLRYHLLQDPTGLLPVMDGDDDKTHIVLLPTHLNNTDDLIARYQLVELGYLAADTCEPFATTDWDANHPPLICEITGRGD